MDLEARRRMLRRRRKERRAIEEAIAEANGENVALNRE